MNSQSQKTILLVEDELVIAMVTSKIIQSFGFNVITANTGETAVEIALSNENINLVLADIDLGNGIDGTEVARRILEKRHIPVVFLTSHYEKEYVDKVKEITRYGYIIKNSGDFVLRSSIEMAFELYEAHEKLTGELTGRKQIKEKLWAEQNRNKKILDTFPNGIYIVSEHYDIQYVNPIIESEFGAVEDRKCYNYFHNLTQPCPWCKNADVFSGRSVRWEWFSAKNGKTYDLYDTPFLNDDGSISKFEVFYDITPRKQDEEQIKKLLAEKELLLKEVHHRIKNNMNTVAGIMSMQLDTLNEPSAVEALKDARSRVQSMMILYDKLYRSDDFNKISFKDYFTPLVDEIIGNFPNREMVKTEKNIDDFMIDAKRLSPLGIIINELLTNIMKYAFVGRGNGLITFSAAVSDGRVTISVGDNGIGIPESVDFSTSDSFGLQLVYMMTRQLRAAAKIDRDNGTKFTLEFKL